MYNDLYNIVTELQKNEVVHTCNQIVADEKSKLYNDLYRGADISPKIASIQDELTTHYPIYLQYVIGSMLLDQYDGGNFNRDFNKEVSNYINRNKELLKL